MTCDLRILKLLPCRDIRHVQPYPPRSCPHTPIHTQIHIHTHTHIQFCQDASLFLKLEKDGCHMTRHVVQWHRWAPICCFRTFRIFSRQSFYTFEEVQLRETQHFELEQCFYSVSVSHMCWSGDFFALSTGTDWLLNSLNCEEQYFQRTLVFFNVSNWNC